MSEEISPVDRLVNEFGAQNMGTYMDARVGREHVRVAVYVEGLEVWQPTEAGIALLSPPVEDPEATAPPKAKNIKVTGATAPASAPAPAKKA